MSNFFYDLQCFTIFISRKIVIHDTSPFLFKILLEYLYSGRLKQDSLSTEQLVELLLLSDRYEMDSLKVTCENALLSCVDDDSVFYFLSMSDQYNATLLKVGYSKVSFSTEIATFYPKSFLVQKL